MTPAGVLHVVFASSDAVHGFLGPATRELASLGQSQSVILIDDAAARGHLPGLQRHARVVLVRGDGEGEGDGRTRHRAFYEACRREIVERRPATLHFHGLASCAIGAVALRRCAPRATVFYSPHGGGASPGCGVPGAARAVDWLVLAMARALIHPVRSAAILTSRAESAVPGGWGGSRHLVERPVNGRFLEVPREEASHPLVLSGGAHRGTPPVEVLSQIAVLLGARELNIAFTWIGDMGRCLASRFEAAGIHSTGIGPEHHVDALARGWLYVAPWRPRGHPMSLIQAMAAGLPGVVLDCPRHRQVVEHGRTGLLCRSVGEMVGAVARLIDEPALRKAMGDAARDQARARFGPARFRASLLDAYVPSGPQPSSAQPARPG